MLTLRPIAVLTTLALSTALPAQRLAEVEPNDTLAQAQPITEGAQVIANLVAGEQDWFTFTLAQAAEVHLRTSGNFAINSSVDTAVLLYDATGTTRLAWNDGQIGVHSDCGVNLPAGTYTCMVIGKTGTVAGDYGLDVIVLPAAVIDTVEGAEPNDAPVGGGTPTPITLGDTVAGEIATTSDVDWFGFTLTGRAIVQAIIYDDGGVPQLDNTKLTLMQETGPGVYSALGSAFQNTASHRVLNFTHTATLAAGNYAFEVSSATTTATGTAPLDYVKTGKYGMRTRLIDLSGSNVIAEAVEPNNTVATAAALALGDVGHGNISGMNEADWWLVAVGGPTTIAAMSDDRGALPITNTTVTVKDVNGTTITSASSGGTGSHGKAIASISSAGLYVIEVSGGAFAATGDYAIYFGETAPLAATSKFSTTPPSTNACPGSNALRPALVVANGEVPQAGSTFVVRLQNALPSANAALFFGFPEPTPIDLGVVGAPGCFLRVTGLFTAPLAADGAGVAYIGLPIGANAIPGLLGFSFSLQAALLDATNNALGISMSNDVKMQLGDRAF